MRKAFRHTGVLMMLGVVALGLVGAAYTLWYEDLILETTIETGTLDADWSFHAWAPDSEGTDAHGFLNTSASGVGKPVVAIITNATQANGGVASHLGISGSGVGAIHFQNENFPAGKPQPVCTGTIGSTGVVPGDSNDVAQDNKLTLEAYGLFPYAGCEWEIDISNDGTVPFHVAFQSVKIQECLDHTGSTCNGGWTDTGMESTGGPWTRAILGDNRDYQTGNYAVCQSVLGADWTYRPGSANPGPEILNSGNVPVQIHGGESVVCRLILVLDQNAQAEGRLFRYTVSWRTFQWNESPADSLITNP